MKRLAAFVTLCTWFVSANAFAQHEGHGAMSPDQIGSASVKFETSCAPAVRDDFNKAVALLHSFWFPEARKMFEGIAQKDANCAVAHWGMAMSQWGNPFGGLRQPATVEAGKAIGHEGSGHRHADAARARVDRRRGDSLQQRRARHPA